MLYAELLSIFYDRDDVFPIKDRSRGLSLIQSLLAAKVEFLMSATR